MSSTKVSIGERLNIVRKEKLKITQEALSEKCGISVEFYRLLEKGEYLPNINVLNCIHKLGGDVDYILTGIEAEKSVFEKGLGNIEECKRNNICNLLIFQMKKMLKHKDNSEYVAEAVIKENINLNYTPDERIKEIIFNERKYENVTNSEIANDLNKSKKTINRWLNGTSELKTEMVLAIYEKYGYFPSYILYGELNSNSKADLYFSRLQDADKKWVLKFMETLIKFI